MRTKTSSTSMHSISKRLDAFERLPGVAPEWIAFALYVVLLCIVASFHEPWFDEAQSWQIARVASLRDILFTIPHYEGHPPLWHLLLALPARLGVPYELGLKAVNLVICSAAVWLLLFRSPFLRIVKLSLPFTFFLFYQFGAISRPYSLLFLAFVLAALAYPARNERPFRYVLPLVLLCLASAYGLVLAGGIALVWLIELLQTGLLRNGFTRFIRDRRVWALALLLLVAIVNLLLMLPAPDTYATSGIATKNSLPVRLLYTALVLPADACFYDCFTGHVMLLTTFQFYMPLLVGGIVLGLLFWAALIYLSRNRHTTTLLLIPYILFAVFSAFVYISRHHVGIAALFLLFWLWVDTRIGKDTEPSSTATFEADSPDAVRAAKKAEFTRALRVCLGVLVLSISIYWTVAASVHEIQQDYGYGRTLAAYLKEHNLESSRIMCGWGDDEDPVTGEPVLDTNNSGSVTLLPYFAHNIVFNLNGGSDAMGYATHRRATAEENEANFRLWAAGGAPDLLLGPVDLESVYGDEVTMQDYVVATQFSQTFIWKAALFSTQYPLYQKID
ncbi:MAG: hypothetical protein VB091_02100 [Christensenella sp.]|nr:hypothetical protein [Christensenella sp.]